MDYVSPSLYKCNVILIYPNSTILLEIKEHQPGVGGGKVLNREMGGSLQNMTSIGGLIREREGGGGG